MAGLQNGPLPTSLYLLSDLGTVTPGEKVRFLGCVTNYSTKSAILTLEHNHPPGNPLKALVDIKLVLGSIKSYETRIGEWVNVMGYVVAPKQDPPSHSNGVQLEARIQAILLWSAGPLKLDRYEESLEQRKTAGLVASDTRP